MKYFRINEDTSWLNVIKNREVVNWAIPKDHASYEETLELFKEEKSFNDDLCIVNVNAPVDYGCILLLVTSDWNDEKNVNDDPEEDVELNYYGRNE